MLSSRNSIYGVALIVLFYLVVKVKAAGDGNSPAEILMITLGGTKSHKVPFLELGSALIARGHNVTLISAFPPADSRPRSSLLTGTGFLEEIAPLSLVSYVLNYTDWDLLGARMSGKEPLSPIDIMRYGYQACDAFLSDSETKNLMRSKRFREVDLIILDGAYPECALGLVYRLSAPFIYINTVGFYTGSLSLGGNPAPFSVTPFFGRSFIDRMSLWDRTLNTFYYMLGNTMHHIVIHGFLQSVLRNHLGPEIPNVHQIARNVSFILQNAHFSVSYPRPYLPNVAEIACIHCRPPHPLPKDLEDFVSGGDEGFIFVSMGSSVRSSNMPERLRKIFIKTFSILPYRVLWKWEAGDTMPDLPSNVRLGRWLPQQDILGHHKLRAFVTHGGLLSMFESVYHSVPIVTMPVFCDHDSNAAKAALDGYALKLELRDLTVSKLTKAIRHVVDEPRYRENARYRSRILRDQPEPPLARAVYWTEYVLRHRGAYHLQSPAKDLNWIQYYLLDVGLLIIIFMWILMKILLHLYKNIPHRFQFSYKLKIQ